MTESEMQTHLMPSEEDIASFPQRMDWSKAVAVINDIVMGELTMIRHCPDQFPTPEDAESAYAEVCEAWNRIQIG